MRHTRVIVAAVCFLLCLGVRATEPIKGWIQPTAEELSLTSVPEQPGAVAIYLNREEVTVDDLQLVKHHVRIKVLTEAGKRYAEVRVPFFSTRTSGFQSGEDKSVQGFMARTIHADGTVVPFEGKPQVKSLVRAERWSEDELTFMLPDVEVGSILEYRYNVRMNDDWFEVPEWSVQTELYTRSAHFLWYASARYAARVAWFPVLPAGTGVIHTDLTYNKATEASQSYELNAQSIRALPEDKDLPPLKSFAYRVRFFLLDSTSTASNFWQHVGALWSKDQNTFMGPDKELRQATEATTQGAMTDDAKLRKIYSAVEGLENTDYTRTHSEGEIRAAQEKSTRKAKDVLLNGRGDSYELTRLFVAMARAAGLQAYVMGVPDRDTTLFVPQELTFRQFTHDVAVVMVDGKERFFDPGSRYCPYGQVRWNYTFAYGVRQSGDSTKIDETAGTTYPENVEQRVGDLVLRPDGAVAGTMTVTYTGAAALQWREVLLRGDEQGLRKGLEDQMKKVLAPNMEVEVAAVDHVREYEQPLVVLFNVHGKAGQATARHLLVPQDVLVSTETTEFPEPTRSVGVDFKYPRIVKDAIRIKLPEGMRLEAVPQPFRTTLKSDAAYSMSVESKPDAVIVRRNLTIGQFLIPATEYPELRSFYGTLEAKDRETLVLTSAGGQTATASAK